MRRSVVRRLLSPPPKQPAVRHERGAAATGPAATPATAPQQAMSSTERGRGAAGGGRCLPGRPRRPGRAAAAGRAEARATIPGVISTPVLAYLPATQTLPARRERSEHRRCPAPRRRARPALDPDVYGHSATGRRPDRSAVAQARSIRGPPGAGWPPPCPRGRWRTGPGAPSGCPGRPVCQRQPPRPWGWKNSGAHPPRGRHASPAAGRGVAVHMPMG
jgi:hypothetical protein